jgi:HPt (histidine-containing phosphotransfer) domain-containing protein
VVEALLADPAALAAVGQRAQAKARSWTERDNALALVQHVQQALGLER